jgi:excisionase family DNA binding protein
MRKLAITDRPDRALADSRARATTGDDMTDTASPPRIANLTDAELLSLYLSLPPGPREEEFINTAHASEITGVSMRTIQLWIERGAVRAILIGGKYRIVFESLRAHLESQINKWGD